MKLLIKTTDYNETIKLAEKLEGIYDKSVIFHCYWNGNLNEKHLYSVMSCYYFNVFNNKHKIVLWLENNNSNHINEQIAKYCEIKYFSLINEIKKTNFINTNFYYNKEVSYYSDVVRYLLLYNYSGCWFDLDCFILRSFDPIFKNYENEICVYQWENQNYPNGAIFISLHKESIKMKENIIFIISRNKGWGFKEAQLNYDLPLNFYVLPCSWFNADWIKNSYNIGTVNFFKNTEKHYNFENFFKYAFCYNWHNKWNMVIEENSIINQLISIIKQRI